MIDGVSLILELIYTQKFQKAGMSILNDAKSYVKNSSVNSATLTINSSAGPWLALANSVSEFIGCLGCRMSRQPGPAKADLAFLASVFQWQFLAISADG